MFGLGIVYAGIRTAKRLKRVVKEGKDLPKAMKDLKAEIDDLSLPAQAAWKEIEEFVDAILDLHPATRD